MLKQIQAKFRLNDNQYATDQAKSAILALITRRATKRAQAVEVAPAKRKAYIAGEIKSAKRSIQEYLLALQTVLTDICNQKSSTDVFFPR